MGKTYFFVGFSKATDDKSGIRIRYPVYGSAHPDPYQYVTDPEDCLLSSNFVGGGGGGGVGFGLS